MYNTPSGIERAGLTPPKLTDFTDFTDFTLEGSRIVCLHHRYSLKFS
ncbi:MAG: hypothetical protein ACI9JL_003406 [Paracoccaceae bacterium]|jgi:hypothetical protein